MGCFPEDKTRVIAHISQNIGTMKIVTLRVPDEMASLIEGWAKFIPGMEIVSAEEADNSRSRRELDEALLARAIENCMPWFWGNSAYGVVFCICRDVYGRKQKRGFEKMVKRLPFSKVPKFRCPLGTISRSFGNNPIFKEHIDNWTKYNPSKRILKLRDELMKRLFVKE